MNFEHLLDVFTPSDEKSTDVWDACARFIDNLYWHKPRLIMLGPKIEAFPDGHPSKAECLQNLSWLVHSVGNQVERKRILTHTLKLRRERGDDCQVALTLSFLSDANQLIGLPGEGIQQAKETSEILGRLGDIVNQVKSLLDLAWALHDNGQLDAAEEAASRAINLLPEKGEQLWVCEAHRVIGEIYNSKGDTQKTIHHLEMALEIGSSLNLVHQLFWVNFALADMFYRGGGSMTQTPTSNVPSHTRSMTHTSWLARWICRLGFG